MLSIPYLLPSLTFQSLSVLYWHSGDDYRMCPPPPTLPEWCCLKSKRQCLCLQNQVWGVFTTQTWQGPWPQSTDTVICLPCIISLVCTTVLTGVQSILSPFSRQDWDCEREATCPESNAVNLASRSKSCAPSHNSILCSHAKWQASPASVSLLGSCELISAFLCPIQCLAHFCD